MRVLGLRTYRDHLSWALVDGTDRTTATVTGHAMLQIPSGERGASLAWVREQVNALIAQEQPQVVVVCPAEGSTVTNALTERAQTDGVVLEALHVLGIPTKAKKSATIRYNFGASSAAQLATMLGQVPSLATIPPTAQRRDPAIAAVSELPA